MKREEAVIIFHSEYYDKKFVQSEADLYDLVGLLQKTKRIYFDTETSGLRVRHTGEDYIVGWTFAVDDELDERVFYIPVRHIFEGKYEVGHIDWGKQKYHKSHFPEFKEEDLAGEYYNLDPELVMKALKPILEGGEGLTQKEIVAHNESFDFHVLANEGVDISLVFKNQILIDTMVAYHTIDEEGEKKLESIVSNTYGLKKTDFDDVVATVTSEEKKQAGLKPANKASFQHTQIAIGGTYSMEDVWFMKQMTDDLINSMIEDESYELYTNERMQLFKVLWNMERRGMRVDVERCKEMEKKAVKVLEEVAYQAYEICGAEFNLSSKQQLAEILFGHKKMLKDKKTGGYKERYNKHLVDISFKFQPISWTTGGKDKDKNLIAPQTKAEVLEELLVQKPATKGKNALTQLERERQEHEGKEVIRLLLKYAKLEKLRSSFMTGLLEQLYADGKAHPSFNICGTDSWRLSCDSPNLQQLPKPMEGDEEDYEFWKQFEIRELFIPDTEDDCVIAGDWSNLEKRLSAHMTKDENLIRMFNDGLDGHGLIATIIFPELKEAHPNSVKKEFPHMRQTAKGVGFAMDYGGTSFAVSRNLGISKEEAQVYIDRYFEGFSGLAKWGTAQKKLGARQGYVTTLFGHKRHLSGIHSDNMKIRSYYERLCLNSPVQGSAADVATKAQILADNDPICKALNITMRIQVHD